MIRVAFVFIVLILLVLSSTCSSAAELEVVVVGLKNQKGDVHIALFNKPDHFPYQKGVIQNEQVSISDFKARFRFTGLPVGKYGIAVYHDKNSNDEFDQGFFGIPLEDYGFSNNARVFITPPSFEDAKLDVSGPLTTTKIDLGK